MIATATSDDALVGRQVRLLSRAESLVPFTLSIVAYAFLGFSWWLFAATLLLPDLSMLGYLRGNRTGAIVYNLAHVYLAPFALGLIGWFADIPVVLALAVVWSAHIGMDRLAGYGLKRASGFKDTYLAGGA